MQLLKLHLGVFRTLSTSMRFSRAYLDPGTGSMILQVILGGVAGAAVAVKMFWHRVAAIIPFGSREPSDDASSER